MGFRQRRIFEKYLTKFVLGLFLWERQTWRNSQAGRQVLSYPTVGSDLLSSPPARALHLSQRHLFPFFSGSLSATETKFGSRTYPVIASLVMKLALRAATVFYAHLNSETQHWFFPCRLIEKAKLRSRFYHD